MAGKITAKVAPFPDVNEKFNIEYILFLLFAHKGHKMLEEVEIKFAIFVEKSRDVQL